MQPASPLDPRPCLVLVPGLACDDAVWQPMLPAIEPHARVWIPPPEVHESIPALARAVLRGAPASRFALAGHSLGGRIALEVMRQAPWRVSGLALLDTGWQPNPHGAAGAAERAQRLGLVELARHEGMRAMGRRWSPGMLHPARLETPLHEAVLAMVGRQSVERFAAQQRALIDRPDAGPVLDGLGLPTLVLCGRQDLWSPLARHEEMADRIAGARLAVIEDCGHMSPMEQPQAVSSALLGWLPEACR